MEFTYIVHLISEVNDISAMDLLPAGRILILAVAMLAWQLLRSMWIVSATVPKWYSSDFINIICTE